MKFRPEYEGFRSEKHDKTIGFTMKSMLQQVFENVEESVQKGTSKVPFEKPANQPPWFEGGASSKSTKQVSTTASKVKKKVPKWMLELILNR